MIRTMLPITAIGSEQAKSSHLRHAPRCVKYAYAAVSAIIANSERMPLHGSATSTLNSAPGARE